MSSPWVVSGAAYSNCGQKDAQQSKDELDVRTTAKETITDVKVRCLGPDHALVDIYQTVTGQKTPKGVDVPTRHIRMTQIHEKRNGAWMIRVHRVADLRARKQQ